MQYNIPSILRVEEDSAEKDNGIARRKNKYKLMNVSSLVKLVNEGVIHWYR